MITNWEAVSTLDRMLDDVMGAAIGAATTARSFNPAIDVHVDDKSVVFTCDVPGMKQSDLELTIENRVLTVKGERKFEGRQTEQILLARAYGSFVRAFTLPDWVDDTNMTADLADGVLTIRVPKHPTAQPRKIPIGVVGAGSDGGQPKQLGA
jgi:HSP20 family protein